jgi:hypothetical protein
MRGGHGGEDSGGAVGSDVSPFRWVFRMRGGKRSISKRLASAVSDSNPPLSYGVSSDAADGERVILALYFITKLVDGSGGAEGVVAETA